MIGCYPIETSVGAGKATIVSGAEANRYSRISHLGGDGHVDAAERAEALAAFPCLRSIGAEVNSAVADLPDSAAGPLRVMPEVWSHPHSVRVQVDKRWIVEPLPIYRTISKRDVSAGSVGCDQVDLTRRLDCVNIVGSAGRGIRWAGWRAEKRIPHPRCSGGST